MKVAQRCQPIELILSDVDGLYSGDPRKPGPDGEPARFIPEVSGPEDLDGVIAGSYPETVSTDRDIALLMAAARRVVLLAGGHDRGLDWAGFAEAMKTRAPATIVTMGQNGPRIRELLAPLARKAGFTLEGATDLVDAIDKARAALAGDGVVLLSPGAPSFGPYRDYVERGRDFARLGGFDPDVIAAIPGLGIASSNPG